MRTGDMPKTMSGTLVHVVKNNGILGLYSGLSASLLRQITYSTVRFGIYEELKQRATKDDSRPPAFATLIAMASVSGFIGGFSGNAADVLNVRMQHDAALPPAQRRNYPNALFGMLRMAREEGLASWFRGVWPNSLRAAAMTASQVASYDIFKRMLLQWTPMKDGLTMHFSASFLAGVAAATVTSPIDVIKTRVMSASGKASLVGVIRDLFAAEGLKWMFKGWVPSFLRLGP
jgi:solute carrier family 25 (mitochondrial dicarboxylate transporter), member 10